MISMKKQKTIAKSGGGKNRAFYFLSKNPRGVLLYEKEQDTDWCPVLFGAGNGLTNPNAAVYAEGGVKKICAETGQLNNVRETHCARLPVATLARMPRCGYDFRSISRTKKADPPWWICFFWCGKRDLRTQTPRFM
jgi:hypothetical protein